MIKKEIENDGSFLVLRRKTGEASEPDNVIIYGGKTGTTEDAGACLALLSKDLYGNPYLSVILHASTRESLYTEMNQILALIEN